MPEPGSVDATNEKDGDDCTAGNALVGVPGVVGSVLSTVTWTAGVVMNALPAASVITARTNSGDVMPVVFQFAVYGELELAEVAIDVHPDVPFTELSKTTDWTLEPTSLAVALSTFVVPCRKAEAAGAVSEPAGAVLSTVTLTLAVANV